MDSGICTGVLFFDQLPRLTACQHRYGAQKMGASRCAQASQVRKQGYTIGSLMKPSCTAALGILV